MRIISSTTGAGCFARISCLYVRQAALARARSPRGGQTRIRARILVERCSEFHRYVRQNRNSAATLMRYTYAQHVEAMHGSYAGRYRRI
jgi:isopentenyl diphosphate isomerase/L-lactate dehydrogenase-like FMN-dependent dehydrogenase